MTVKTLNRYGPGSRLSPGWRPVEGL